MAKMQEFIRFYLRYALENKKNCKFDSSLKIPYLTSMVYYLLSVPGSTRSFFASFSSLGSFEKVTVQTASNTSLQ